MKIYVASSWRNEHQQSVVNFLRECGHEVYDFKKPSDGKAGFHWSEIDPNWKSWTTQQYREALRHEYAQFGFNRDFDAMEAADACVLVLPCGRSAHLEAGWMKGAGKTVFAYIPDGEAVEPELMYNMLDGVTSDINEIAQLLSKTPENDNSATATITTVNQKAIAAIANEIRARAGAWPDEKLKQYDLRLADRIEEAVRRECAEAREIAATTVLEDTKYVYVPVGNAAKLREAVVLALSLLDLKEGVPYKTVSQKDIDFMKAALAEPPRQCDVGTAEEQEKRFSKFCGSNADPTDIDGWACDRRCPLYENHPKCKEAWGQMSYTESEVAK